MGARYFTGGREITEEEAREIERETQEILRIGSIEQLLKIKLVSKSEILSENITGGVLQ